ncbi:MAG: hypothetical protein IJU72_00555 [Bacteroidales bacterium]|nr:hypothetical protein [Bacteroidales bacterium]
MIREVTRYVGLAVLLFAVQLLVLNNINFNGYASPYIYPMLLLVLPFGVRRWQQLLLGFACGLLMDVFMHSLGLHATAMLVMSFVRLFVGPSDSTRLEAPGLDGGLLWYARYVLVLVLIHHTVLILLASFTLHHLWLTLLRIALSTACSVLFILIASALRVRR